MALVIIQSANAHGLRRGARQCRGVLQALYAVRRRHLLHGRNVWKPDLSGTEERDSGPRREHWQDGLGVTLFTPPWAGVLSTAGNLVLSGSSEGLFYALDAQTGELLWNIQLGGEITANPMAYAIDGHEYLVIAADRVLYAFDLPKTEKALAHPH